MALLTLQPYHQIEVQKIGEEDRDRERDKNRSSRTGLGMDSAISAVNRSRGQYRL